MWKKLNTIALVIFIGWVLTKGSPPTITESIVAVVIMGTILQLLPSLFLVPIPPKDRLKGVGLAILVGVAAYVLPRL